MRGLERIRGVFLRGVFVVLMVVGFGGSLNAITNAELSELSESREYLCDRDTFYCNKENIYNNFIDKFDLYSYEKNRLLLSSTENLTLNNEIKESFQELKNLKYGNIDKYNISDVLVPLLKISIINKNNLAFIQYLNEINSTISNHNLPSQVIEKWQTLYQQTEIDWDTYHDNITDPFYEKHLSLKGFAEYTIDSFKQLKSSAIMAWHVSERTFLRPVKYAKQLKKLKEIKNLLAKPQQYYDLVMIGYKYLTKENVDEEDLSDSDKINAIIKLIDDIDELLKAPPFNSSGNEVINLITLINTERNIFKQHDSIMILEEYYKDNEYLNTPLYETKLYLKDKSLQTLSSILVSFSKLTALDKIDGLDDLITIGDDLIKNFIANTDKYRSSMERYSLSKEYLEISLDSLEILNKLYIGFIKEINPYAKYHIANNNKLPYYSSKQKEMNYWIADFEVDSEKRVDKYVTTGEFYKAVYTITKLIKGKPLYINDIETYVQNNDNAKKIITIDKAIWMIDKFSSEAFKQLHNKYLILYLSKAIRPNGKEVKRRINKIIFKKLGEHQELYIQRQFISMQGKKIARFSDTLKNLDKNYISGYQAIDFLYNYYKTLSFYEKGAQ